MSFDYFATCKWKSIRFAKNWPCQTFRLLSTPTEEKKRSCSHHFCYCFSCRWLCISFEYPMSLFDLLILTHCFCLLWLIAFFIGIRPFVSFLSNWNVKMNAQRVICWTHKASGNIQNWLNSDFLQFSSVFQEMWNFLKKKYMIFLSINRSFKC